MTAPASLANGQRGNWVAGREDKRGCSTTSRRDVLQAGAGEEGKVTRSARS